VEYSELPNREDLEDLIERARNEGEVVTAELRIVKDVVEDLR
jgi:hypothetical protein